MKIILSIFFSIFICLQLSTAPTDVVIPITTKSTVADLFTYIGEDGEKHFKFPDTPHFQDPEFHKKTYPATYNQYLTLGAFLRFTKRGNTLFEKESDAKEFTKLITLLSNQLKKINTFNNVPNAEMKFNHSYETIRKELADNLTRGEIHSSLVKIAKELVEERNTAYALNNMYEKQLINLLEKLPLSSSEIESNLSYILSTKPPSLLLKSLLLASPSRITWRGEIPYIQTNKNSNRYLGLLYFVLAHISLFHGFVFSLKYRTIPLILGLIGYFYFVSLLTINLEFTSPFIPSPNIHSPEPGDGISVSFELQPEPEPAE